MMGAMRIQNIEFKSLSLDDLQPGLLDFFNRFQRVTRAWRTVEGERKLVDAPFIDNWDSHSAEETQAFYQAMGCVDAVEVNVHHAALEPFDIQMEYVIVRNKDQRTTD